MVSAGDDDHEIYALQYAGPLTSSGAFILWMREWEKTVERAYFFWCVKGQGGPIVVDCGVSPELARQKELPGYISPAEALKRIGVDAAQVPRVVLTHLHWDHYSAINLFPKATIYVQKREYDFWVKDPIAKRPAFAAVADEAAADHLSGLEGSDRLVLIDGDQEILPGVELLLAPGHTPGLQAVAVKTAGGTAIIGSDCAHFFRNYAEDWPSVLIADLPAWMKTYDKLKAKAASAELLFPGHDPLMLKNYPRVADGVARLA